MTCRLTLSFAVLKRYEIRLAFRPYSGIIHKYSEHPSVTMRAKSQYLSQIELGFVSAVSEEPADYELEPHYPWPEYEAIGTPDELRRTDRVASDLAAVDWAFATNDTRFLTHDLHPYPSKFIPQIPGH